MKPATTIPLFDSAPVVAKTYRAIRHDIVRAKQRENAGELHHPREKINQVRRVLSELSGITTLELFAGRGTTLITAKKLGRNYVGIELSEEYVKSLILPGLAEIDPLFAL